MPDLCLPKPLAPAHWQEWTDALQAHVTDQPMSPYHLTPDPRSCSPMRSVCKLALPRTRF